MQKYERCGKVQKNTVFSPDHLRYGFAKNKAILNLYCNDIFETGQISPRIRFKTQNVTNHYSCFREFGVSFTYKFGGYKEKQREAVDTSRFK